MSEACWSTDSAGLGRLLDGLRAQGRELVGPLVRDGAIVFGRIEGLADLPRGWTEQQEAGRYRLRRRGDDALFGYTTGPGSLKRWFFPPRERLWSAVRGPDGALRFEPRTVEAPPLAIVGARGCDLAALAVHDRVFGAPPAPEPGYLARRRDVFVIAVHCAAPAPTCFCTWVGTGPRARDGFDIALTELVEEGGTPRYLLEAGSERGRRAIEAIGAQPAVAEDREAGRLQSERCAAAIERRIDAATAPKRLLEQLEHPRWAATAERCLACGNCTSVCPTCFCSETEEQGQLGGELTEHVRVWDSCFTLSHSEMHGRPVRASRAARYRQWLTHKFATWHEQFGTSGCVGCGRCITWCPVGIDVTEEIGAICGGEEAQA